MRQSYQKMYDVLSFIIQEVKWYVLFDTITINILILHDIHVLCIFFEKLGRQTYAICYLLLSFMIKKLKCYLSLFHIVTMNVLMMP